MAIKGQESKEFFINGKMFLIEPYRKDDELMKLTLREVQQLPAFHQYGNVKYQSDSTLGQLCSADDPHAEVLRATFEGLESELVALAIFHFNESICAHEMAMLVKHEYSGTRLPYELMESLLLEAKTQGVKALYTTDNDQNITMRNLADKFHMSVRQHSSSIHDMVYSLNVDDHPGIVQFPFSK